MNSSGVNFKGFDTSNYQNLSLKIVVPSVRPFIYVENGKIISKFPNIDLFTSQFPPGFSFFEMEGYEVGMRDNKTGQYNGLIGYLQRGQAAGLFHPVPIDIENPPGKFGVPLYDSGFGTIKFIRYPKKETNDLAASFFDFKLDVVLFFIIFYIFIVFLLSNLLPRKTKFSETSLILYRIMFKEHNLDIKKLNYRFFIGCILIYYLLINIIIEQSVNTNLVITKPPKYVDKIDDIYEDKKLMVHFIKNHYTYQYFANYMDNKKLKEIYERSLNCKFCINNEKQYLYYVYNDVDPSDRHYLDTHLAIGEENSQIYVVFALLVSKKVPEVLLKLLNKKTSYIIESGLVNLLLNKFRNNVFGFQKNTNPIFKICLTTNEISNIQHTYSKIKFDNLKLSITLIFMVYFTLYILFISQKIYAFLKNIFSN